MSAYITVGLSIIDADKFQQYGAFVPATLEDFGGEVIAKGPIESLHNQSDYDLQVILRFPDKKMV